MAEHSFQEEALIFASGFILWSTGLFYSNPVLSHLGLLIMGYMIGCQTIEKVKVE